MVLKDYYAILGVTSDASQEDIKQAYRRLARKFHPDVSQELDASQQFREIQRVYETLKNPETRAVYDRSITVVKPYTYKWFKNYLTTWINDYFQAKARKEFASSIHEHSSDNVSGTFFLFFLGGIGIIGAAIVGSFLLFPSVSPPPVIPPITVIKASGRTIINSERTGLLLTHNSKSFSTTPVDLPFLEFFKQEDLGKIESIKFSPISSFAFIHFLLALSPQVQELPSEVSLAEPVDASSPNNAEILALVQECEKLRQMNYLTVGKRTALSCYRHILEQDPQNGDALNGLETLERHFQLWAETALNQQQLHKARIYIAALKKINAQSTVLPHLKQRLKRAIAQQKVVVAKEVLPVPIPAVQQQPKPASSQKKPQPIKPVAESKKTTTETKPPPQQQQPVAPPACGGCSCAGVLRQLSMGMKPLNEAQKNFLHTQCR